MDRDVGLVTRENKPERATRRERHTIQQQDYTQPQRFLCKRHPRLHASHSLYLCNVHNDSHSSLENRNPTSCPQVNNWHTAETLALHNVTSSRGKHNLNGTLHGKYINLHSIFTSALYYK